ncbi:putative phage tail protein [Acetanaerobacterium elongatum]|uniref:DUF2313 domain-containing protein n=1 Tax=Acetanaerobacterium elongatum TaxID=258515 RepID=A0A1H0EKU3_9FIRM|nr:putative phage tail protein [Acetanaerobacterium elongatum]SDN82916.1 hypothetical protein SAMN05192585_13416 [Acetanaerobacterium elongatum]
MNCLESMVSLLRPVGIYSLATDSMVYRELQAYYSGLKQVEDELAVLRAEGFIQTAQSNGLRTWEEIIRSTAIESGNLESRRGVVLYTLSRMPQDFNLSGMLRGLRSLGLDCELTEDTAHQTVRVDVLRYGGALKNYEDVYKRVCDILPAHISVTLNMGSMTWALFDAQDQSFEERDQAKLTWDTFENSAVVSA